MLKKYTPNQKEKYMCPKQKTYFKKLLSNWKNEIIKASNKSLYLSDAGNELSSADIIDQATSQTEKTVEMRTINRQRKLLSKMYKTLKKFEDNTYGYCEETSEHIGLKRLIARPIATLSIESQERHERDEKIYIDD